MRPTSINHGHDLAELAVDTFVAASLACMEGSIDGRIDEGRCERLFHRAQFLEARYLNEMRNALNRAAGVPVPRDVRCG